MPVLQVPELQWGSGILEFGKYNFYTAQRKTTEPLFSSQAPNWAGSTRVPYCEEIHGIAVGHTTPTYLILLLLLNTIYCKMHKEQWNTEVVLLVCVFFFQKTLIIDNRHLSSDAIHFQLLLYSASNSSMKNGARSIQPLSLLPAA